MKISLPEALRSFVDEQVSQRGCGTSSEYLRELIRRDQQRQQLRGLFETVGCDLQEVGPEVGLGFIDELERACKHLGRHLATGSPRYAHQLNLPGLSAGLSAA